MLTFWYCFTGQLLGVHEPDLACGLLIEQPWSRISLRDMASYVSIYNKLLAVICCKSGLLKLGVKELRKWVPDPSHVGHENAVCRNFFTVMTSPSLLTNNTGPLYNYFTCAN